MSFSNQKFNEMVLQLLFSLDMGDCLEEDMVPFLMRELSKTRKTVREAYREARSVYEERVLYDETIRATSREYALERIGRVERNVLRLALFKLDREAAGQRAWIISEALRLTRKFSTKEAATYVNALLDADESELSHEKRPTLPPQNPDRAE